MKRKTKRIAIGCLGAFTLYGGCWLFFDIESPLNRNSAFSAVYEWARLEPIPSAAKNISISTTGSMFSREFNLNFDASKADIESWLSISPGTKSVTPEKTVQGDLYFKISPGGGAQGAEVTVSSEGTHVWVHAYWS